MFSVQKNPMTAFKIKETSIAPGEEKMIKIHVARLPSGTPIGIRIYVFRSSKPGPIALVLGGVHGDEINGVEIVRRVIEEGLFSNLKCGSVIAIPLLNVYGFINYSREVQDGKDVNRSFPGSGRGSLASRVAHIISKQILPLIDFGLDFHTGGGMRYNYPQIRFSLGDPQSKELAQQFGAPFYIEKPFVVKSLRRTAYNLKKPVLVYEGGESLRLDGFSIDQGIAGMKRVLKHKQMLSKADSPNVEPIFIKKTSWIRAPQSGMFTWTQSSGQHVEKGEPIGYFHTPYGEPSNLIRANKTGYIIGHNNMPVVNAGDALFHIGTA